MEPKLPPIPDNYRDGQIIGYKKCKVEDQKNEASNGVFILQLSITRQTRRNFPSGKYGKARAEKAKVLRIWRLENGQLKRTKVTKVAHRPYAGPDRYGHFHYELGKTAKAHGFNDSTATCGAGINFFLDITQARNY
jgi:hypothetical protein